MDIIAASAALPTYTEVHCVTIFSESTLGNAGFRIADTVSLSVMMSVASDSQKPRRASKTSCVCRVGRFHSVAAAAAVIPQKLPRSPTRRVVFEVKLYLISNIHDNYLVSGHRSVKIKEEFFYDVE